MESNIDKNDAVALYFNSLRAEVLEKIKLSHRFSYFKLLSIGALLGVVASKGGANQGYEVPVLITLSIFLLAFDLSIHFNTNSIIGVGNYIREHIEPELKKQFNPTAEFCFWEEYVSIKNNRRRIWWNLFEAVQPVVTLAVLLQFTKVIYDKCDETIFSLPFMTMSFLLIANIILIFKFIKKE